MQVEHPIAEVEVQTEPKIVEEIKIERPKPVINITKNKPKPNIKLNFNLNKERYENKAFIPDEGSKSARLEEESKTPVAAETEPTYNQEELNSIINNMKELSARKEEENSDESKSKAN